MDDPGLSGRAALVTGGGTGIGRPFAPARSDGRIRLCSPANRSEGQAAGRGIDPDGAEVGCVLADLKTLDGCHAAVDSYVAQFGRIDILVNNAAVTGPRSVGPFLEMDDATVTEILAVNLQGPLRCAQRAAASMEGGVIVNIGSVASYAAQPDAVAYV